MQANIDRGTTWEETEVLALIEIWADEKVQQQLDSCTRKKPIFEKMAQRLKDETGFERTFQQVREKIKQLKQNYKKVKDNNSKSGHSRKTCKYFEELDSVMGDRPITRPANLLESSLQENIAEDVLEAQTSTGEDLTSSINGAQPENFSNTSSETEVSLDDSLSSLPMEGPASISGEMASPLGNSRAVLSAQTSKGQRQVSASMKGKSKKRSRNEAFMSNVCSLIQKQQQESDERFFKMEEERWQKEMEKEEKRRKEEMEHDMRILQMMGNMFMQATSCLGFPIPQVNLPQMQQTAHHSNFTYAPYQQSYQQNTDGNSDNQENTYTSL